MLVILYVALAVVALATTYRLVLQPHLFDLCRRVAVSWLAVLAILRVWLMI
jgi:hypothetical protein